MKRNALILAALVMLTATTAQAKNHYLKFLSYTIEIADSTTAAHFTGTPDSYSGSFSKFDMEGRMQQKGDFTEQDYLTLAAKEVRNWDEDERNQLANAFKEIETFIKDNNITFHLPDTIMVIKTHGQEEFGAAGYTRGNAIILNADDQSVGTGLVAHELFHVFSRHNSATRDSIYSVFGFKKCNPISVTAALDSLNITNPDCPVIEHYITVDGEDMVLILYSNSPYNGGSVFEKYVTVSLLAIEEKRGLMQPKIRNYKPIIYDFQDKMKIFEQVGFNTPYLLHPEEISAEHFTYLITKKKVKQPEYVERMKKILQGG